jgi:hypothetical protein
MFIIGWLRFGLKLVLWFPVNSDPPTTKGVEARDLDQQLVSVRFSIPGGPAIWLSLLCQDLYLEPPGG